MREYKGKDLQEALENAADGENIDVEYLNYNILKEDDKEIIINVYFVSEVISFVKDYIEKILSNTNVKFQIEGKQEKDVININIESNHDAVLIGVKGNTLQSLNTLVRGAIINTYGKHHKIIIDIGDYKEKKYEELIKLARRVAKEVKQTKIKAALRPMPADERRIVHNTLSEYKDIKTESEGFGKMRKIIVSYKEE